MVYYIDIYLLVWLLRHFVLIFLFGFFFYNLFFEGVHMKELMSEIVLSEVLGDISLLKNGI